MRSHTIFSCLLALVIARPIGAQQRDTTRHEHTVLFATALGAGLAANAIFRFDRDPGGYPVKWYWRKDELHVLSASVLTSAGIAMHVAPWKAAALTCAAGALYEKTQGFVNRVDIAADCGGAAVTAGWHYLWNKEK
jgi:hypothetical protein